MTLLHGMDPADLPFLLRLRRILCLGRLALLMMLCARVIAPAAETQQQPEACGPPAVESEDSEATLDIRADSQEKDKGVYHLRGHVEATLREMKLTADEATYDERSQEIAARGHVTFTDPDAHLEAEEGHYNLRTSRGQFLNGHGHVRASVRPRPRMRVTENQYYFQARKIERLDPDNFTLRDASLSSCEHTAKGWSVAAGSARIRVDDKMVAHGAVFRLLRVPLFYAPVLTHAIGDRPRQSGFLLPHLGNSSQKGVIVGEGIYWAINRSADLLLGLENFSARGPGAIGRFHALPSSTSEITMDYFGVDDRGGGPLRQSKASGQSLQAVGQASDLGHGFRGVVDVDYISSLTFRQTFADSFQQAVTSEVRQTGFLTKNFDAYSINFQVSRYQDFLSAARVPGNSIVIRQTPGFSFSGMDRQVGRSPLFVSFETAVAGVGRAEPGFETPRLSERVDFSPQVTLRSKPFWGFHLTPSAGLRATHYGTSLIKGQDSLNRILGDFSVDLRPPSLDKILSRPWRGYRFKHVIEPNVRYHLVRAPDAHDLTNVVRFDETDILAETNEIEYSLNNSILIRKDTSDGAGDKPQARELVSLRLSQKYYFDPTFGGALVPGQKVVFEPTVSLTGFAFAQGRRLSPLVSVLKFSPFSNYDTEARADFNPSGGGVLNAGITSHLHRGRVGLAATEFFVNRTATLSTPVVPAGPLSQLPSFNLLRVVATYGEVSRKGFSTALGLDYNFSLGIAHQAVSQASYNFGCFALDFEYRRLALGTLRRENQFRIALSLANIGTFGNLKPRERLY